MLTINTVTIGLTIGLFASVGPTTPILAIVGLSLAQGFFNSLQFLSMNSMAYADAGFAAAGFAAAAGRMGLSTSAVSRHVAQLEAHLNVRLLNRTTRRMSPTGEGFAYFERCTQRLADLEESEASVSGKARNARGRLRLTAPIALATLRLAPAFAAFSQAHRQITLDIMLSDNVVDFAEEGVDLAIRVGRVGSDNLVARRIGETALLAAPAPAYLERAGTPGLKTPSGTPVSPTPTRRPATNGSLSARMASRSACASPGRSTPITACCSPKWQ